MVILDSGKNEIVSIIANDLSGTAFSHIAIGSDGTAEQTTDTSLGNETGRESATTSNDTTEVASNVARFETTFDFTSEVSNTTFAELGVVNASSGGTFLTRTTLAEDLIMQDGDKLIGVVDITYSPNTATHNITPNSSADSATTNDGASMLAAKTIGDSNETIKKCSLGSDTTTTPSTSDSSLVSEIQNNDLDVETSKSTSNPTNNVLRIETQWTSSSNTPNNFTVGEVGVFASDVEDTLGDDSSGNDNNLNPVGNPTTTSASDSKYGDGAVDLDGNDGYKASSTDFELTDIFGYVFVGVIDSTPDSGTSRIMAAADDSGSGPAQAILAMQTDGTLLFNDNSRTNVTSSLSVPTGETVGIVARRDSTDNVQVHVWDSTNNWREFINDDRADVTQSGNSFLGIGMAPVGEDQFLDGQVDHAEVYKGSTTPSIATLKDRADPSVSGTGGTGDPNGNEVGLYEFEGEPSSESMIARYQYSTPLEFRLTNTYKTQYDILLA